MKKLLILSGAAALVFSSCGTKGGNLKDVTDTLAYTMGMELGEYVKNMDSVHGDESSIWLPSSLR